MPYFSKFSASFKISFIFIISTIADFKTKLTENIIIIVEFYFVYFRYSLELITVKVLSLCVSGIYLLHQMYVDAKFVTAANWSNLSTRILLNTL